MYRNLSKKQKDILNYGKGEVVVKACPGSGKTYSVAARISRILHNKIFSRKGIAALSFTNVACNEIESKLAEDFNIQVPFANSGESGQVFRLKTDSDFENKKNTFLKQYWL
ncbi:MAG: UvrD-helicase domain-containing protein [Bacteroidales bacterium]